MRKSKDLVVEPCFTQEGEFVNLDNCLIEYPNPRFQRSPYQILNGRYAFEITKSPLIPAEFTKNIMVPFPVGSLLSGIKEQVDSKSFYHYRRNLLITDEYRKDKTILNIIRISGFYEVFLNGKKCAEGHDDYNLKVELQDHIDGDVNVLDIVCHKSKNEYVGITGPVYLESVYNNHIESVDITYDIEEHTVTFNLEMDKPNGVISILTPGQVQTKTYDIKGNETTIELDSFIKWDLNSPFFYQYEIITDLDKVKGTFAIIDYKVSKKDSILCLQVNGKPYPIKGILDNYFYPDGLITMPSHEHTNSIISEIKKYGFNSIYVSKRTELPYFYYNLELKGMLSAVHIVFEDKEIFIKQISYLRTFDVNYLFIIENISKDVKSDEVYQLAKMFVRDKLVLVTKKKKTTGDIEVVRNEKEILKNKSKKPMIYLNLSFDSNYADSYIDFLKTKMVKYQMKGMIAHYFSSLNSPVDGIFQPTYKARAHKSKRILDYNNERK